MFGIRKKVTFINEQNWRNTVQAVALYSTNQDLSLFLEGVFSADEKGSFNIGKFKLDDSVMQIALLRHKI